jgi:hypothetical protein
VEWETAEQAARAAQRTGGPAGRHAVQAAIQSAVGVTTGATLNEVTGHAVQAHALAAGADAAQRVVEASRQAIQWWLRLSGLVADPSGGTPALHRVLTAAAA